MAKHISFILALAFVFSSAVYAEESWQSHESIAEAVQSYVVKNINFPYEYELTQTPLDGRLKLPQCPQPIEAFSTTDVIKPGRTTIGVRCNSEKRWSIFTSVIIKTYQMVVVSTRPILRGEMITAQHLTVEKRDISNLREDFITEMQQIENKQAVRSLDAGTILSKRYFVEPQIIKKGEQVIISSSKADFSIRMNGIAMMDGVKGQVIRVKNQSSGRIINAIAVEPGLVVVNY